MVNDDDHVDTSTGELFEPALADEDLLDEPGPAPFYPNAAAWVEGWLLPHYKRKPAGALWDPRWWEYTEVIATFEALWQAWEALRLDSLTGPAIFIRDFLWPMMREITSPEGPFWRTAGPADERKLPEQWELEPPPAGMFRDADHPDEQ